VRRRKRPPHVIAVGGPLVFPDPNLYDDEGLVAVGGDLAPERLLLAYDSGIFPWYEEELPVLWWSPNPRAVIEPGAIRVSRSMRRVLRDRRYEVSVNRAFTHVMRACADRPEGTWISDDMVDAYTELHRQGHAVSFEVWLDGELIGGLYGVWRGGLFAAESMFHRRPNASKLALVFAHRALERRGIVLFEVQFLTPHLVSLGASSIPRPQYLERLSRARCLPVSLSELEIPAILAEFQS